jgi:hypothetical protein
MQTDLTTIEEPPIAWCGSVQVGFAVTKPALEDLCQYYFFLLANVLYHELAQAGLCLDDPGGVRTTQFVALVFTVIDRDRALGTLREAARRYEVRDFCEIAWRDDAEQVWRTVHPTEAEPFDRLLNPELLRKVRAELESQNAEIKRLRDEFSRQADRRGDGST